MQGADSEAVLAYCELAATPQIARYRQSLCGLKNERYFAFHMFTFL